MTKIKRFVFLLEKNPGPGLIGEAKTKTRTLFRF